MFHDMALFPHCHVVPPRRTKSFVYCLAPSSADMTVKLAIGGELRALQSKRHTTAKPSSSSTPISIDCAATYRVERNLTAAPNRSRRRVSLATFFYFTKISLLKFAVCFREELRHLKQLSSLQLTNSWMRSFLPIWGFSRAKLIRDSSSDFRFLLIFTERGPHQAAGNPMAVCYVVLICLTKRFQWGAPLYGTHS